MKICRRGQYPSWAQRRSDIPIQVPLRIPNPSRGSAPTKDWRQSLDFRDQESSAARHFVPRPPAATTSCASIGTASTALFLRSAFTSAFATR